MGELTKQQCMAYIWQEIKDLDEETLIKFGQFVWLEYPDAIKEHVDGCRIHLDPLPEGLIKKMYQFVKNQVDLFSRVES
jgi:hypothetical protein